MHSPVVHLCRPDLLPDPWFRRCVMVQAPPQLSGTCWLFRGWNSGNGYGKVKIRGRAFMAHRAAYLLLLGDIPEGLVLDHLCRRRACINPAHMQPVTPRENTLAGEAVLFKVTVI